MNEIEVEEAINLYENGKKAECLSLVENWLNETPVSSQLAAEVEVRKVDGSSQSSKQKTVIPSSHLSKIHWLELAKARLIKEITDPTVIAFTPVLTCLRTIQNLDQS